MFKKILTILLISILLINVSACNTKTRYSAEFLVLFDTVTQIISYSSSEKEFTEFSQFIYDNLQVYHQLYDIYNSYEGINNIKSINDQAGIAPVKVDKKIIDLLLEAKEMYTLSDGEFNIAYGAVLKIWHQYREAGIEDPDNAALPPMEELKKAAEHIDINNVIIDENASTVYLADSEMSLDVGGIAKGYATEQVCKAAQEKGYTSGLVSVGGNVRAIGDKEINNHELWNVGIQNPDMNSEQKILHTVLIKDLSVVTSGDYQRYYTVDGKIYHHIIDPQTLMPADHFKAVTIICKDSGTADGLSTIIFNMPYEKGSALIENLADTEALWVFADGTMKYSSGYEALIKNNNTNGIR